MKKPGIVTRFDDVLFELTEEYKGYCEEICDYVRQLCVRKGQMRVAFDRVTYLFCDGMIECKFAVDVWENIDAYEISFRPLYWNKLPKGYHYLMFRKRGWNVVFRYKNCGDTPMLLEHIPGEWTEKLKKRYLRAMKKKNYRNKFRRQIDMTGTMIIQWTPQTEEDE